MKYIKGSVADSGGGNEELIILSSQEILMS